VTTDGEFLAALEACTLPASAFRHADHLRAAYLYLRVGSFADAVARMTTALRRYAASQGKPERYHETITVAYLALVNQHLQERGDAGGWEGFLRDNPDLFDKRLLLHYYRPETLSSARARQMFLLGEFAPQPHEAVARSTNRSS
jgi:hypothetical protein